MRPCLKNKKQKKRRKEKKRRKVGGQGERHKNRSLWYELGTGDEEWLLLYEVSGWSCFLSLFLPFILLKDTSLKKYSLWHLIFFILCVPVHVHSWVNHSAHEERGHKTSCRSQFSPLTVWMSRVKLRSLDPVASTFTGWATSSPSILNFLCCLRRSLLFLPTSNNPQYEEVCLPPDRIGLNVTVWSHTSHLGPLNFHVLSYEVDRKNSVLLSGYKL